jgi:predicted amino acid dehydrogenase
LTETKPSCPQCNKNNVAVIFWGYPADMDEYLKAIEDKEIVPGGCLVSDNDPKWECTDCFNRWGARDEDDYDFDGDMMEDIK